MVVEIARDKRHARQAAERVRLLRFAGHGAEGNALRR
jgi:hypothetical protein